MKSWALAGMFMSSLAVLAACGGDEGGEGGFGQGGSTSTTMTGSGGAGGSGTGGSASMCDQTTTVCNDGMPNTGDCAECAVAEGALCRSLAVACGQNAACAALDTCLAGCAPGDGACISNCDTMNPNGVVAHDALEECIFCQACPTVCDDPICMQ